MGAFQLVRTGWQGPNSVVGQIWLVKYILHCCVGFVGKISLEAHFTLKTTGLASQF